jgi:hypothetical protein
MTNHRNLGTEQARAPRRARRSSLRAVLEWGMLALVITAGAVGWWVGIVTRNYDYDEVQRAHSIWLASQGLRPYDTLFEVHPPYFILLTPILRRWTDPCVALFSLRLFSAVGNLAFLGGLAALGWKSLAAPGEGRWALLGVASVAFHPKILDFLVEFRIDGWGYALAAWSILGVLWLRRPGKGCWFVVFGVVTGIATLLFCPKLALLPPLIVAFELLRMRPGLRTALGLGAAYMIGLGIAGIFFVLYLGVHGISLERTYLLLFRYHTLSNAHSAYHHGLLRQIAATPLLLVPIVLGLAAWIWDTAKQRTLASAYPPALGLWLVIQAVLVAYHYKQYYAPWFLFASAFVILLGRGLDALWRPLGALAFVVVCGTTIVAVLGITQLWQRYNVARGQCATILRLNQLALPGDAVVAPPAEHPIVHPDVFFLWFNTSDPGGYDSERILESLGPYRRMVSLDANRAALESHHPAFVVLDVGPFAAPYPAAQWEALREFLPRHGYRVVRLGAIRLALRPDRYQWPRDAGLLLFEDDPGPLGPIMPAAR